MKFNKGQTIEIVITDMAIGGKALGRFEDMVVFVDLGVPGDKAEVLITKNKKNYAEGKILSIIKESQFRVDPPCRYFGFCGGCKWQFIDYKKQLEIKTRHVKDAIEHIGLLKDVTVHPAIESPQIFAYRNKMEFSSSDKRWLLPDEMGKENIDQSFALGLHVPGTFNKVMDIDSCMLQPELGNFILNDVKDYIKNSNIPVYGLKSHEGFWRFLMLRHSVCHDKWMVNIITGFENLFAVKPLADLLTKKYPDIVSVVNNITGKKALIAVGEYEICLAGESFIKDRIGGYEFEISANSFFQTNTPGAENLYEIVKHYADLSGSEIVFDLYSGTGTISIFISALASDVFGFEIVQSAVMDAEKNCKINKISNCSFVLGDIKTSLLQVSKKPDVMIIDPPRVGMHKEVLKQVMDMGPARIVYVSCNPATLARDLGLMKEKYDVVQIQPVDMFPHTFHVEAVAGLIKRGCHSVKL